MKTADLKKYYIAEWHDDVKYTAGVRHANETILSSIGFKPLKYRHYIHGSAWVKLSRFLNSLYFVFLCEKKSLVAFHFPLHAGIYKFLLKLFKMKGVRTVAIIIDIDGVRDNDKQLLNEELTLLNKFDFLIVHNDAMRSLLKDFLPDKKMFSIDIFDYPSPLSIKKDFAGNTICIAGNFNKAKYVYNLNKIETVKFNLYGTGYDTAITSGNSNVVYKGSFEESELISKLEGSFGLVWDGDGIETCEGNSGKYLRYNNPYKLSLYLAAGLPVIVWRESAVASFVEKNQIGIAIDSLYEVADRMEKISSENYREMVQNLVGISQQLRSGHFLSTVIEKIMNEL